MHLFNGKHADMYVYDEKGKSYKEGKVNRFLALFCTLTICF